MTEIIVEAPKALVGVAKTAAEKRATVCIAGCPYCKGITTIASHRTNRSVVKPDACKVRVVCDLFKEQVRPPHKNPCPRRQRAEARVANT